MSDGATWLGLGPPQPPEVTLREALVHYTSQMELYLAYLPRVPEAGQHEILVKLITSTAESQILMVRLLLQKYH